jgi:hypothetical protein
MLGKKVDVKAARWHGARKAVVGLLNFSTLRLAPSLVSTAAAPPCQHVSQAFACAS